MMRVNEYRAAVAAQRFLRVAVFTVAGTIGVASQAEAAIYYWQGSDPFWSRPGSTSQRHQKTRHQADKKLEIAERASAKPQGPLIIAISIAQQKMRIYDANGFFAETPVSTGMPGHPTPMGVFSVIQKQKLHHSNIYSGAPMPYMQRITWSGVAMHAGVLPGHPASHGCIRMPMTFAVKMWNWTRMGARVVITPGEITPASFSHPALATVKVQPQPAAADEPKLDAPAAAMTTADTDANTKPAIAQTSSELRSTLGHDDGAKPPADEARASTLSREQTRTADAGNTSPASNPPVTMSDAAPNAADVVEKAKADASPARTPAEATPAAIPELKNRTRPNDAVKATIAKPDPAAVSKRAGQIAVFVSRKDSKLYVRQNFAPLFDVPVIIAPSDRPLGTHVFTAQVDKDDPNALHWSVVSLPASTRYVDRRAEDERGSRRRKITGAGPIEVKPLPTPDSPAEALDRLNLPADTMARITEALSTGGSIIVSDQGISAGETGEGTDFIVSLR
jgi:lipoprotein-anchoring transpeptidase ErfK/SrfK